VGEDDYARTVNALHAALVETSGTGVRQSDRRAA